MSEIKSALEIALERTKSVEVDPQSLEVEKYKKEGKVLVSKFLNEPDFNLKEKLKAFEKKQLLWAQQGMLDVLKANIVLPQDKGPSRQLKRIAEALSLVSGKSSLLSRLFSQLEGFFDEYLREKERLREALEQHYAPKLKQKEEELSQQLGQPVKIDINADPEFGALLRKNIGALDEKYGTVLSQAKKDLTNMLR
jgi:hypothetical protein